MGSGRVKEGFRRLSRTFQRTLGMDSVRRIQEGIASRPVITIGGDQLTGKSTLGRQLAEDMGADYWSTGKFLRKMADERGVSVAEMSRQAAHDPIIDVTVVRCRSTRMCVRAQPASAAPRPRPTVVQCLTSEHNPRNALGSTCLGLIRHTWSLSSSVSCLCYH